MSAECAELSARLFADASADGVPSHGLNRFPLFVSCIERGLVDVSATPECVASFGGLERWDGRRGPGNLNAHRCMDRAIELARTHGVGAVALAHTNHWMRGGAYGWQAADAGVVGICWTNTLPNLPPWGATSPRIGNNPLVIGVPRAGGHVVLDMAMSQFSYGALSVHRMRGQELPVDGGYDEQGRLTRSPAAIERTQRLLPIGYWKGSGLSVVLDMIATLLSGGQATHEITPVVADETGQSQVFVAFDPSTLGAMDEVNSSVDRIVEDLHQTGADVRYPGERTLATRQRSMSEGVEVEPSIWEAVRALLGRV
ncbi:MAG: Malate/L-lactate dehydrogenase [Gemmatimonadetes bacterium]|nr:Malate/L-lactate dehydrogenase [Gemmatimonadota bacterium]